MPARSLVGLPPPHPPPLLLILLLFQRSSTIIDDSYSDLLIFLLFLHLPSALPVGEGREFPLILGRDVAGKVEAVGSTVTQYKPGDDVFAAIDYVQQV